MTPTLAEASPFLARPANQMSEDCHGMHSLAGITIIQRTNRSYIDSFDFNVKPLVDRNLHQFHGRGPPPKKPSSVLTGSARLGRTSRFKGCNRATDSFLARIPSLKIWIAEANSNHDGQKVLKENIEPACPSDRSQAFRHSVSNRQNGG